MYTVVWGEGRRCLLGLCLIVFYRHFDELNGQPMRKTMVVKLT